MYIAFSYIADDGQLARNLLKCNLIEDSTRSLIADDGQLTPNVLIWNVIRQYSLSYC